MGRILMLPQYLATFDQTRGGNDATPPQADQLGCKSYHFKCLRCTLDAGHIPVVRAAQRGRDWQVVQTHPGARSRSSSWKKSSRQLAHSVFWPSWRPATKAGSLKIMSPPSPLRRQSRSNPCLRANIIDHGTTLIESGRGIPLALTAVAQIRGAN